MATLNFNGVVANVKTMLKNLSAWQVICNVSTAAEAAERIYEYGVTDTGASLCPCIILDIDSDQMDWQGGALQGALPIDVRMELEIPDAERTSYATEAVWFWTKLSALLDGINTSVNDGGELMLERMTLPLRPGLIDPDENQGRREWMTVIRLEITVI